MNEQGFQIDWLAFWLLLVLASIYFAWRWWWAADFSTPHLRYSKLRVLRVDKPSLKVRLQALPKQLLIFAIASFCVAFLDPHMRQDIEKENQHQNRQEEQEGENRIDDVSLPTEGIAIYLILDRSGSMAQDLSLVTREGKQRRLSRMEYLKRVTTQFVKGSSELGLDGRQNDLIGLVTFARVAHILSPLTHDHREVLEQLSRLDVVRQKQYDGTAMGYAVFKTVNMIVATRHFAEDLEKAGRPAYNIKNTVIVLVTDGLQNTNPLDRDHDLRSINIEQAADYAQEHDVRLYIVDIEPAIMRPEYEPHRRQLQTSASMTGGQFFVVDNRTTLQDIYKEIDTLERSALPINKSIEAEVKERFLDSGFPKNFRRVSYYPFFIALGLLSLAIALVLNSTWLRRVP